MQTIQIPTGDTLDLILEQGDWNTCVSTLKQHSLTPCSARDLAYSRIQARERSHLANNNGFWTSNAHIYAPNGEILAVKASDSPLLQSPREATQAHREGREFSIASSLYNKLRERASDDAAKALSSGVLLFERPSSAPEHIPIEALQDHAYARFVFEDQITKYAAFLKDHKIKAVPLYTVPLDHASTQPSPFVRALWVGSLGDDSGLNAYVNLLYNLIGRVLGVARFPASAGLDTSKASVSQVAPAASQIESLVKDSVETEDFLIKGDKVYVGLPRGSIQHFVRE